LAERAPPHFQMAAFLEVARLWAVHKRAVAWRGGMTMTM